jgi:hypothetical protein
MSRMTFVERVDRFEAALAVAVSGRDADQVLAEMSARVAVNSFEQISLVAALGDTRGPDGSAALRAAFAAALGKYATASRSTRPEYRDHLCACVIALAKRDGPAATDVYATAAGHANPNVREYGMTALAPVGDDRAWEEILARLDGLLARKVSPTTSHSRRWEEACGAIEYLARHSGEASGRGERLVTLLRARWRNLPDPQLIERWWPGIGPGGPPSETVDLPGSHLPHSWWQ